MSHYRICEKCGAALDPGERCDCDKPARNTPTEAEKLLDNISRMTDRQFMLFLQMVKDEMPEVYAKVESVLYADE